MATIKRFRKLFESTQVQGYSPFQTYYGAILRERQDGGPNAEEARRDFEQIRNSVGYVSGF